MARARLISAPGLIFGRGFLFGSEQRRFSAAFLSAS